MNVIAVCPKCNIKELYPSVTQEKQTNQDVNLMGPDRTNDLCAAKAPELQRAVKSLILPNINKIMCYYLVKV